MKYKKIRPGHPAYERVQSCKKAGLEACDSVDHNEDKGCSNPACFKHPKKEKGK